MATLNKNTTYSPKDILAIDGKVQVKSGRGRMAKAAVDRIHELVNEGYQVKGYAMSPNKSTDKATAPVVKAPITNAKTIAEYVIFWDEAEYKAMDANGKEWGMREVCNNCHVSLVQCHCNDTTILGDVKLTIVRR